MAQNFMQFAASWPFPTEAAQDFANITKGLAVANFDLLPKWFAKTHNMTDNNADNKGELIETYMINALDCDECEGCCDDGFELCEAIPDKDYLYVGSGMGEYVDPYPVAKLLMEVMQHHNIQEPVSISGAYYCSKLRAGEFGGFAFAISANGMMQKWIGNDADEMKEKLRAKIKTDDTPKP